MIANSSSAVQGGARAENLFDAFMLAGTLLRERTDIDRDFF